MTHLSSGQAIGLVEHHLCSERIQEQFTDGLVNHHISRVPDWSTQLIPQIGVLCGVEPGENDHLFSERLWTQNKQQVCHELKSDHLMSKGLMAGLMLLTLMVRI